MKRTLGLWCQSWNKKAKHCFVGLLQGTRTPGKASICCSACACLWMTADVLTLYLGVANKLHWEANWQMQKLSNKHFLYHNFFQNWVIFRHISLPFNTCIIIETRILFHMTIIEPLRSEPTWIFDWHPAYRLPSGFFRCRNSVLCRCSIQFRIIW
jgi:hypothetical protein